MVSYIECIHEDPRTEDPKPGPTRPGVSHQWRARVLELEKREEFADKCRLKWPPLLLWCCSLQADLEGKRGISQSIAPEMLSML